MRYKPKLSRRNFLASAGLAGAGIYTYQRGLRYPRLSFEHRPLPSLIELRAASIELKHTIYLQPSSEDNAIALRAIAPEPELTLQAHDATNLTVEIANIARNAILSISGSPAASINESIDGINRSLEIRLKAAQSLTVKWSMPEQGGARFAVIGDTGAGLELEWALQRADQLGVEFLLHLGDFNYSPGEYDRAIELFRSAPMPCYVTIGNHDFNESGLVYQKFLDQIGPMNHAFSFAGSRFVNIDTAADYFPASGGRRGALFTELMQDSNNYFDQIYFTHRPFKDPREGREHVIGGIGEIAWLQQQIKNTGCNTILTGHVHRSAELDIEGIHQWTIGEGLGFEDILHQKPVAKLVVGQLELGRKISYQWQPLNMPWPAHLSPTHEIKLKRDHPPEKLEWYRQLMKNA